MGLGTGIAFIALFAIFFAPPTPTENYEDIDISDFGLRTYFLFSDIDSKVVDFEVDWDTSIILMTVDVSQDTELRIRFHEHLFEQLEHQARPEGYRFGDYLEVFVDEVHKQVEWEYTELEGTATIQLEAGARSIEIVQVPSST